MAVIHEMFQQKSKTCSADMEYLNLFCASLFFCLGSGFGGSVLPLPRFSFESFELSECRTPLSLLLLEFKTGDFPALPPEAMNRLEGTWACMSTE